jgi:hypothetical protein
MFQLTADEAGLLRSQIVTLKSGRGQHAKYLPYAFTENGVAMLSSVLNSDRAIAVNVNGNGFLYRRRFDGRFGNLKRVPIGVGDDDVAQAPFLNLRCLSNGDTRLLQTFVQGVEIVDHHMRVE